MTELMKRIIDEYNNSTGDKKGYDCSKCKNRGDFLIPSDDEITTVVKECECAFARRSLRNAKISGLGNYINKTFADFKTDEEWQKSIYNKAIEYIKDDSNAWFVITGQSGAGKTLICSIIANDFLFNQRKKVIYLTWTDFIGKVKRNLMGENALKADSDIERAKNAEILFIDEFLKTHTEADLKYIVEIINYRYSKQLKTIITSELSADELMGIDEATAGRIKEMAEISRTKYIINIGKDRKKNQRLKIVNA